MRKLMLLFLCLIMMVQYTSAQITLSSAGYTSTVAGTTDTLKVVTLSTVPAPITGANQTWDFSAVTYDSTFYQQHAGVSASTWFPLAQYADTIGDSIGYYYYYYHENNMNGIAPSGLLTYGRFYNGDSLGVNVNAGIDGYLKIFSQNVVFSKPVRNIAFPATYGTTWADTAHAVIHGTMTVVPFQYNNAGFEFRSVYIISNTVTGWGTLKIKNSAGVVTNVNVLQVKSTTRRSDSTFVGNTMISESQHDATELPVGFSIDSYEYKYYAADEVTPIVDVFYDYSFTTPQQAVMLSKKVVPSAGIAAVTATKAASIHPNPVNDHIFYISGNNGGRYDVLNSIGQMICGGECSSSQSSMVVLPKETASGVYYVRITDNDHQISTQKIVVE